MRRSLISRLTKRAYRFLRRFGVAPSASTLDAARRKTFGRDPLAEMKLALLDEARAQSRSGKGVFASRLLDRLEELTQHSTPLTAALLSGVGIGPGNRENLLQDPELTENQQHALNRIIANPITFLMGAAATGKTRVISQAISHFLGQGESVLFCCNTRAALDHAVSHLAGSSESLEVKTVASAVASTSSGYFDTVVVDEAGMTSLPEVLVLSSLAQHRIVFVGDPVQLPPIAATDNPWLNQNIFQWISKSESLSGLYVWQRQSSEVALLLREQFDIPNRISGVLGTFCYGGRLFTRSTGSGHLLFIDTSSHGGTNEGGRSSPTNSRHAEIVAEEISRLTREHSVKPETIGVLTPFAAQAKFLERTVLQAGLSEQISFGTAHTFQGRLKNSVILDIAAAGVDYAYRNLADDDLVLRLMNSALSRCRTANHQEGRLIVIADLAHIRDQYPESMLLRILTRLYFRADVLKDEEAHKYSQTTRHLIEIFLTDWKEVDRALAEHKPVSDESIRTIIYNACDLIPRLIMLINRLRSDSFQSGYALSALEKPYAALALANRSVDEEFNPERIDRFKSIVTDLYKIIYESTMTPIPGEHRNRGPEKPVYDPDADAGSSYGRVRIWIRELRNYYQHDSEKPEDYRKEFSKRQRDFAFQAAISRDAPDEQADSDHNADDYTTTEYLRVALLLFKEAVDYLSAVRTRLV